MDYSGTPEVLAATGGGAVVFGLIGAQQFFLAGALVVVGSIAIAVRYGFRRNKAAIDK